MSGRITSIDHAIQLLGLNALKNIAIAASLTMLFRNGRLCADFDARDLWTHCSAVAIGSQLLARHLGMTDPDELFVAGLIHDLGIMVEMQACRTTLFDAIQKFSDDGMLTFCEAETATIGANHEHFGAALCHTWKFPLFFAAVTGYHHRPMEADPEHRTFAMLVHVADVMAAKYELGYSRMVEHTEIAQFILNQLHLEVPVLDHVAAALPEATEQTLALLRPRGGSQPGRNRSISAWMGVVSR